MRILLVEDSPVNVHLMLEALGEIAGTHQVSVCVDGEDALETLEGVASPPSGDNGELYRPDIIILDLNLPKVSGLEVLRYIKSTEALRDIPVLVLTNSDNKEDVISCYLSHANAYIRKPLGFEGLLEAIKATWEFWADTAVLPGRLNRMLPSSEGEED